MDHFLLTQFINLGDSLHVMSKPVFWGGGGRGGEGNKSCHQTGNSSELVFVNQIKNKTLKSRFQDRGGAGVWRGEKTWYWI